MKKIQNTEGNSTLKVKNEILLSINKKQQKLPNY